MATEDVAVRLRLEKAKQFMAGTDSAAKGVRKLGTEAEKANRKASVLATSTRKLGGHVRALGSAFKFTATLGIGALVTETVRATKGWADHLEVTKRTEAVIKSTGSAAGVTAKHVGNLSDSIERQTGVDGDAVQSGANLLLTFTNIRNGVGKNNKIFDQATATTVNMSKALGQSTKTSAIQLGKALNDPVKGVTALQKVGVSFTDQQKEQIKALVKSGHTMDAQKIILRELGKEFPKVKPTAFERLQVTLHSLEDRLGKFLLPLFNKGVSALNKFLTEAQNGTGTGGKFISILKGIGNAINKYLIKPISSIVNWFKSSRDRLTALGIGLGVAAVAMTGFAIATALAAAPVYLIVGAIALLAAGVYYAYQRSTVFRNVVNWVGTALKNLANWIIGNAPKAFNLLKTVVTDLWRVFKLTPAGFVISHIGKIVKFLGGLKGKISSVTSGMWDGIKSGAVAAINFAIGMINRLINAWNTFADAKLNPAPHINTIAPIATGGGNQGGGGPAQSIPSRRTGPVTAHSASAGPGSGGDVHVYVDSDEVTSRVVARSRNNNRKR